MHEADRTSLFCRYMMCSSPEGLREMASWEGKGVESRQKLVEKLQSKAYVTLHACMKFCEVVFSL